jgi:hypothetical protein
LQQLINNYTLMKKATRLLILTAFVLPLSLIGSAYAGGPGPGQTPIYHHLSVHHVSPYTTDGFHPGQDNDPLHLQDPIGDPNRDNNRDDLWGRSPLGGHDRDPGGHPGYDPGAPSGQTAPIDGGISLLLAAGIGLGIKKARSRKQSV